MALAVLISVKVFVTKQSVDPASGYGLFSCKALIRWLGNLCLFFVKQNCIKLLGSNHKCVYEWKFVKSRFSSMKNLNCNGCVAAETIHKKFGTYKSCLNIVAENPTTQVTSKSIYKGNHLEM